MQAYSLHCKREQAIEVLARVAVHTLCVPSSAVDGSSQIALWRQDCRIHRRAANTSTSFALVEVKRKESHERIAEIYVLFVFSPKRIGLQDYAFRRFRWVHLRHHVSILFAEATLSLLSLSFCVMNTIIRTLQYPHWCNLYYNVMCVNLASKTMPTERRKREEIIQEGFTLYRKLVMHMY